MRRRRSLVCALVVLVFSTALRGADLVAKTEALTPEEERKTFKLPPGFEIQLVAAEPDINKPMNLAFDARGRLWVTSTVEYPYPAKEGTTPRDKVVVLSDFANDGKARKVETFAEGLNIPIGILPIENGALVFAIDHIRKMLDTNGDGRADKVEKFLGTFGSRDTHGMTNNFRVGFDGWVYADHGFSNESKVTSGDGSSSITMQSGNVYRFKLDGSRVEHFTHGQVNPFGLCFDPRGDLYSADCHTRPQYLLLRGAYYPSFGKPDDGVGFGPEMITHDHGSTGIAGTVYYAAEHFPEAYQGTLFNGNPVTNRINHDRIEWRGSTPRAIERPDFLTASDAWFRPVDLVLGPDGAIYVADFYNRIIGHYEVPLDHPGRDRERGRIWRIVYRGEDGKQPVPPIPDLAKLQANQLVEALADPNLSVRLMAMRQLVERVPQQQVIDAMHTPGRQIDPLAAPHRTWVLHRHGLLNDANFDLVFREKTDPLLLTHVLRIVAERERAPEAGLSAARKFLVADDIDAHVRRAAADALGRHPRLENVRPLLAARKAAPADDTHLIHTIRMALRDQLEDKQVLAGLPELKLKDDEQRLIADVVAGVANPDVGQLVLSYLRKGITDPARTVQLLVHAARRLPAGDVDSLTQTVLQRFPRDLDVQRQLFSALLEGLAQRGAAPGEATRRWGSDLAKQLAAPQPHDANAWTFHPVPGSRADTANPWVSQRRSGVALWSSHPRGETLTGVLRSKPFAIPKKLRFVVVGHSGPPGTNDPCKNFVRLKLADGDAAIAEARAPRTDVPQPVEWDLSKWAGKQGYLEAIDADDREGFAWIAFGRFDPAVAPTPQATEDTRDRLVTAALIARALKLADLRERMEQIVDDASADPTARAGAARALGAMGSGASVKVLARAAADPNVPPAVRDAVSQSLAEQNSPEAREALLAAIAVAPEPLQRTLASSLAGTREGADDLLAAVAAGKASPRLLQDAALLERLKTAGVPDLEKRTAELTKGLIRADEAIVKLLAERRAGFDGAKASAARGADVYAKHCAACHRVGDVGAVIGPQLDGVGRRGAERIIEDVLDPNRNVDAAFRTTLLELKVGGTVSGLMRREEGELIVLADSTGKESKYEKSNVKRRKESALSLMPANMGETLSREEFNDLVAFLLSK